MKTTKNTAPAAPVPANDNPVHTPDLDALVPLLCACVTAQLAWGLKGWAARLRATAHANHAANSWAKHRGEFPRVEPFVRALTVARMVDYGLAPEDAAALLKARLAARARRSAA